MTLTDKNRVKRLIIKITVIISAICFAGILTVVGISEYVRISQTDKVFDLATDVPENEKIDCVVVLGAGLQSNGKPSHMLEDRIKVGVDVLDRTGADYILMSGDKSGEYYDEPAAMKKYAEEMGVDPSKILIDDKGFSTYESMTRVKDEYGFDNVVVITQRYHLYRALYIAEDAGIEAVGVSADLRPYRNQFVRELREILARVKDMLLCI
ncbi:MAG: YdcF family protein [Clostridia bacterium]|nr:YdcF family protein [Clostridia bacterium]